MTWEQPERDQPETGPVPRIELTKALIGWTWMYWTWNLNAGWYDCGAHGYALTRDRAEASARRWLARRDRRDRREAKRAAQHETIPIRT